MLADCLRPHPLPTTVSNPRSDGNRGSAPAATPVAHETHRTSASPLCSAGSGCRDYIAVVELCGEPIVTWVVPPSNRPKAAAYAEVKVPPSGDSDGILPLDKVLERHSDAQAKRAFLEQERHRLPVACARATERLLLTGGHTSRSLLASSPSSPDDARRLFCQRHLMSHTPSNLRHGVLFGGCGEQNREPVCPPRRTEEPAK